MPLKNNTYYWIQYKDHELMIGMYCAMLEVFSLHECLFEIDDVKVISEIEKPPLVLEVKLNELIDACEKQIKRYLKFEMVAAVLESEAKLEAYKNVKELITNK
jgi:hypothetical protein